MPAQFFKLATFVPRFQTFRDGKPCYPSWEDALAAAKSAGTYRISAVGGATRTDGEPFTINGPAAKPTGRDAGKRSLPAIPPSSSLVRR